MKNQESTTVFDQEFASSYDRRFAKLAPMRDALHLLIRMVLSELPNDARVLCVGVGTGSDSFYRAQRGDFTRAARRSGADVGVQQGSPKHNRLKTLLAHAWSNSR